MTIAHFSYQMKTDTGYSVSATGCEITVDQYRRICEILGGAPVWRETPYTMVQVPCISYSHMAPDTSLWLQAAAEEGAEEGPGFLCALVEGSCFLIPPTPDDRDDYPDDLLAIFAFADKHARFGWIMLDVDGDVQPELTMYGG